MSITYIQAMKLLEQPLVRDLAWVIGSPALLAQVPLPKSQQGWDKQFKTKLSLVELSSEQLFQLAWPQLLRLDHNPEQLILSLKQSKERFSRVRLGIYYEHLVSYFLEHILLCSPLLRELQIFALAERGKQTIGSIDMLGRFSVPQELHNSFAVEVASCHIEAASKFYLKVSPQEAHQPKSDEFPTEFSRYIGPNERDSFGSKLHRVYTHQLPLSLSPFAQPVLHTHEFSITHRLLWCKGRLFLPLEEACQADLVSEESPHAPKALWIRRSQIQDLFHSSLFEATVIEGKLCSKPKWLAPPSKLEFSQTAISHTPHSLLTSCLKERGEKGATLWYFHATNWEAYYWVMIVPDDWGHRALN